jgi:hypothetical protein
VLLIGIVGGTGSCYSLSDEAAHLIEACPTLRQTLRKE